MKILSRTNQVSDICFLNSNETYICVDVVNFPVALSIVAALFPLIIGYTKLSYLNL